jgi:hypothetical protein
MDGKRNLSISQYYQRYIRKTTTPFGLSLFVGSAVDFSVTRNLGSKLKTGNLLDIDESLRLAGMEFDRRIGEVEEVSLKDSEKEIGLQAAIQEARDKAIRLSRLHAIELAPNINPTHLQRSLHVELPGYPFDIGGVLDVQEKDCVRDTKTAGKSPSKSIADTSDQLTVYAMLVMFNDGTIPGNLCLDYLIDNKTPITKTFNTVRTEDDFDVLLRRIDVASMAIERGAFVPARESDWWCSESACGYWKTCKYVRHTKRMMYRGE